MSLLAVPPAHHSNIVRLADFTEIECLRRADKSVSKLDIYLIIRRGDDGNDILTDSGDSSDMRYEIVETAFSEFGTRAIHSGTGYPFSLSDDGDLVSLTEGVGNSDQTFVYLFMLLATRMNMKTERVQGKVDATVEFEHLCKEAAIRHWGGPEDHVDAYVFGTGRHTLDKEDHESIALDVSISSFQAKIDEMCRLLGEGDGYRQLAPGPVTAKDGKLDVVVWRRFSDRRAGQVIGFGQCKTGEHWKNDLAKLRPDDFFKKWVRKPPIVCPVRLYFICDRVLDQWYEHGIDGGILFDRCRILQYASDLPQDLLLRIRTWVVAAMSREGLSLS